MSFSMLIQHGKKMTKLCAVGLRALILRALRHLLAGRCDLATVGRLQQLQPLADRLLRPLVAFYLIFNFQA
jgi:hypothetical protein